MCNWSPIQRKLTTKKDVFEKVVVESFLKQVKDKMYRSKKYIVILKIPSRVNICKTTPRHILVKLLKTKEKGYILKAVREKTHCIQESNIQGMGDIKNGGQRQQMIPSKLQKKKIYASKMKLK